MFHNNIFGANSVCIFLVVIFAIFTKASTIPKEPHRVEFENSGEESGAYDEFYEQYSEEIAGNCENDGDYVCGEMYDKLCEDRHDGYDCTECFPHHQKETDELCVLSVCANGGVEKCKESGQLCKNTGFSEPGYYCTNCLPNYQKEETPDGDKCVLNYCYGNPCLNEGSCQIAKDGYSCICSAGYFGRNCEFPDSCDTGGMHLCRLKGKNCFETFGVAGFKCQTCIQNYQDKNDGSDSCEPSTCSNGGFNACRMSGRTCSDKSEAGYMCPSCLANYQTSSYVCKPMTCGNGGKDFCGQKGRNCTNNPFGAGYNCSEECLENFKTSDDGEECELKPCSKEEELACESQGMSCKRQTFEGFMCDACLPGFQRNTELDVCVQESCFSVGKADCSKMGKICIDKENAGYVCGECLENFVNENGSDFCEQKTCGNFGNDVCASKGMKCFDDYYQGYECNFCLEDYVKADGYGCKPVNCENRGEEACRSQGITCLNKKRAGYECDACLPNFIRKRGKEGCEPDDTCDERGHKTCRSVFKKCDKRINNDYTCGDCLNGYIKDIDGNCVFASCEYIGSYMCSKEHRKCIDQSDIGYKCGSCLNDSYKEDFNTKTCVKATCENIGGYRCSSLKRVCVNNPNGYQCGKCQKGFIEFEGREECVKECSCENAECKYNDKMEPYCSCFRGYGLWTSNVCRACNCGKGVGCYFGIRNRVMNKYCECPNGNKVIDGPCTVTCKNIGYEFCGEMNRVCLENTTEGYDCGDCKEGFVEDKETRKCVIATCDNKGNEECGSIKRICYNASVGSYKCGECLEGFLQSEDSRTCIEDLCRSSPCNNSGICKNLNDSFVCFCHHPFFGEFCEQEIVPSTLPPSTVANCTYPDDTTNSTVDDKYTTEPSNFTNDFNQTTVKIENTETTVGYTTSVNSTTSTSNPTTSVDTTTTTSERPTKSDSRQEFIFRNVYTVRNLTEVIVKN